MKFRIIYKTKYYEHLTMQYQADNFEDAAKFARNMFSTNLISIVPLDDEANSSKMEYERYRIGYDMDGD